MTSWNLPPWDQQTFSFGWEPYVNTMKQCSSLKISFDTDLGTPTIHANPPPAPPYTVIVYTGGYQPLTLAVGNIGQKGTYSWVVNLPIGPTYMLAMKDSAGYTGGVSLRWTMTPGTGCSLSPSPLTPALLSVTRNGKQVFKIIISVRFSDIRRSSQCGNVNYVVNNGTSPFQVEIIPEVRQQKTLHFETNEFGFVLDLPAGLSFFVAITDANGSSAVDGILTVGTSNDNTCLNAAATVSVGMATSMYSGSGIVLPATASTTASMTSDASSTSQGPSTTDTSHIESATTKSAKVPIIAGIVAGVVAISLVLFILYCIRRRRNRQATAHDQTYRGTDEMRQHGALPKEPPVRAYPGALPYQYPSADVPELQAQTPEPHLYAAGYSIPGRSSGDAYTNQANFDNITTHVPRPQSFQTGQTILLGQTSSASQSPYTPTFSQSTGMSSSGVGGIVGRGSLDTTMHEMRYEDEKRRLASPPLPPGAMALPSPTPGFHEQLWAPRPPATPGSSDVRSSLASPPPRSDTGTVLPPYELAEARTENKGSATY